MREQGAPIVGLTLMARRIVANWSGEILDAVEMLAGLEQADGERVEIEPKVPASVPPKAVVEIESVHVHPDLVQQCSWLLAQPMCVALC